MMVNPLLTILFDLFLIGTAVAVCAAMVEEYLASREPVVRGSMRRTTTTRRVVRHTVTAPRDFRSDVARLQARRSTRVRAA
ncbi:MAG: hypothetical protein IT302_07225 [Dehalococcoidia bacterium]|nr:hypothetical protein [Dehalococcoidia bacterium]